MCIRPRISDMNATKKSAVNFETYMKIWNDVLSFLGISPVVSHSDGKGDVYRVSRCRILISVWVIVLSVFILYMQVSDIKFVSGNIGSTVISGYLNLTGNVVTCLNVSSAIYNSKSYASLASCFLKFNRNSLNARVKEILLTSGKLIAFFLLLLCLSFSMDTMVLDEDKDVLSLKYLLNYICELYNFVCVCHFAVCCFWLREYLSGVNREIEKHSKTTATCLPSIYSTRVNFLKTNSVFPEIVLSDSSVGQVATDRDVRSMKFIRRLYHQIYLLSIKVNKVFSTRNLVTVAHNFFLGTIFIYCGLSEVVKYNTNKSTLTTFEICNYFKWSGMSFLSIYGLIWPSIKVYSEVQITSIMIQEYFAKVPRGELQSETFEATKSQSGDKAANFIENCVRFCSLFFRGHSPVGHQVIDAILNGLHSFVLQLFHEKICFSPHGFFSLNNQLLLSIIGAVVSYLVILIQFRISIG